MIFPWHLYLMALLYLVAGINHFRRPELYLRIIPPFFANPKLLNSISGAAEILLAVLLCIPQTSTFAAWGIILLLVAVFPANIYMFTSPKASLGMPKAVLLLRLPMQIALVIWAYQYV
ncbi:MAG: DoxX family protein [Flavobacterium sp.]|nr:MAG: DoxX family protein [Flavobacterium sp.]